MTGGRQRREYPLYTTAVSSLYYYYSILSILLQYPLYYYSILSILLQYPLYPTTVSSVLLQYPLYTTTVSSLLQYPLYYSILSATVSSLSSPRSRSTAHQRNKDLLHGQEHNEGDFGALVK